MFQSYTIAKNSDRVLRFVGELIAEQTETLDHAGTAIAIFKLRIYAVEGGGYVPAISFESLSDRTVSAEADRVHTAQDVENFFYVYEPLESLQKVKFCTESRCAECQQLKRRLTTKFDSATDEIINTFHAFAASQQSLVGSHEDNELRKKAIKPPNRLRQILGLQRNAL